MTCRDTFQGKYVPKQPDSSEIEKEVNGLMEHKLEPINLMVRFGLLREVLNVTIAKDLKDGHSAENIKNDKTLIDRVLLRAFNESVDGGMKRYRYEMKKEIKTDHFDGKLTDDALAGRIIDKMVDIMRKKTKKLIDESMDELIDDQKRYLGIGTLKQHAEKEALTTTKTPGL
uniref:Uncharacterized protein n=1 Tax=Cacopsylla melanoneura TaxID=428564 RepID=A0A8D8QKM2_9HEMI